VDEVEPQPDNPLSVRGRLRVGDRGKELAAGLLQRAFAKGQLSKDDLDHRLSVVLEARIRNDLRPALEDLEEYQLVRVTHVCGRTGLIDYLRLSGLIMGAPEQ